MTKDEEIKIMNTALNTYGIRMQQWMLVEECGELLNAIAKSMRGRVEKEYIIGELVDVSIMVDQMAFFYGMDDFKDARKNKLLRLKERLAKHKEKSV